jgi:hypothetical protein
MQGGATTGSITVDGVQFSSNTLNADQMRESLGVNTPEAEPAPVEAPPAESIEAKPVGEERAKPRLDPTKDPAARISKATFEREEARREAARERSERERLQKEFDDFKAAQGKQPAPVAPAQPQSGDPTFEQLLEKHKDAADPYAAAIREQVKLDLAAERKQAEEAKLQSDRDVTAKQREEHEQRRMASFGEKMTIALAADHALEARMAAAGPDFMLTRPMGDAFIESDAPHKLIAYLLDHPETHQEILAMDSGLKQFRALARLDATLDTPAPADTSGRPAKSKSAAQPPISPVGAGHAAPATGEPDPRTCTQEEFDTYWNSKEKESRLAGARR